MDSFTVPVKNKETGTEREITIVAHVPKVGRNKGKMRLQPEKFDSDVWDLDYMVETWGKNLITKIVKAALKPKFGVFTFEATHEVRKDANGNVIYKDKEKKKPELDIVTDEHAIKKDYGDLISVLSKRGETVQYLKRLYNEKVQEQLEIMSELMPEDESVEPPSPEESAQLQKRFREIRIELKEIEQAIQEKKAADAEDDDDEEKQDADVKVAV